ncbi:MAG: hypothetical protein U0559_02345 [Anaerolineae bacterium]
MCDRTFCFWSDRPAPFDGLLHRSWDQIQLVDDQSSHPIDLGAYRYHMIRGAPISISTRMTC